MFIYAVFFKILFPCRLLQNIEKTSLCYTIGPYQSSIYCTYSSVYMSFHNYLCNYSHNLSLSPFPFPKNTSFVFCVHSFLFVNILFEFQKFLFSNYNQNGTKVFLSLLLPLDSSRISESSESMTAYSIFGIGDPTVSFNNECLFICTE